MSKVILTSAQWDTITEYLLESEEKPLIYLAKEIQMQVVDQDQLTAWKDHLRRNGLNV